MKKVKEIDTKLPVFHYVTLKELLNVEGNMYDTGFYLQDINSQKNIYTTGFEGEFYIVDAKDKEHINKAIINEHNRREKEKYKENAYTIMNVGKKPLTIWEIIAIYKYFSSNVLVDDYFYIVGKSTNCNYREFLSLVKEVILLEDEIEKRKISYSDKEQIMKLIYDKYKMECLYYNPIANYGNLKKASIAYEIGQKNMLAPHAFDPMGMIVYKYATCQGMAYGLAELYNYFGIDAEVARNNNHGVTKVNFEEKGKRYVSYIDLSSEVSFNFTDSKYIYESGRAIERAQPIKKTNINSYDFYLKKQIGVELKDKDISIAFDNNEEERYVFRKRW